MSDINDNPNTPSDNMGIFEARAGTFIATFRDLLTRITSELPPDIQAKAFERLQEGLTAVSGKTEPMQQAQDEAVYYKGRARALESLCKSKGLPVGKDTGPLPIPQSMRETQEVAAVTAEQLLTDARLSVILGKRNKEVLPAIDAGEGWVPEAVELEKRPQWEYILCINGEPRLTLPTDIGEESVPASRDSHLAYHGAQEPLPMLQDHHTFWWMSGDHVSVEGDFGREVIFRYVGKDERLLGTQTPPLPKVALEPWYTRHLREDRQRVLKQFHQELCGEPDDDRRETLTVHTVDQVALGDVHFMEAPNVLLNVRTLEYFIHVDTSPDPTKQDYRWCVVSKDCKRDFEVAMARHWALDPKIEVLFVPRD